MDDRELLERAAKAAGIEPQWRDKTLSSYKASHPDPIGWNPLLNDGDALRLAVELDIDIDFNHKMVQATSDISHCIETTDGARDKFASVRRAIVRAAAELACEKAK